MPKFIHIYTLYAYMCKIFFTIFQLWLVINIFHIVWYGVLKINRKYGSQELFNIKLLQYVISK